MTAEVHGSNYYTNIMLNHLSIGVALYDANTLCLLEANTFYLQELDDFVSDDWRGGKVLGRSIHEWGEIARTFGIITCFQEVIALGQTHHQDVGQRRIYGVSDLTGGAPDPNQSQTSHP